jgi:hypothetical protein
MAIFLKLLSAPAVRERRIAKLTANAQQSLEPGEQVVEVVQVQQGETPSATGGGAAAAYIGATRPLSSARADPSVVILTDQHLYVLELTGSRLLDVGAARQKIPLDHAIARVDAGKRRATEFLAGDRSDGAPTSYFVMKTSDEPARRIEEYVVAHGGSDGRLGI